MSHVKCSIGELDGVIGDILNEYSENVKTGVRKSVNKRMRQMVSETKQRQSKTKRSTGAYVKQIGSIAGKGSKYGYSRIWKLKGKRYRIAHLLNNGHRTRSGSFVSGDNHITNAEKQATSDFENDVRKVLKDAGR